MNLTTMIACATCRLALTEHHDGDRVIYRHPVSDDTHEAVPIDAGLIQPVFNRCHTCTSAPPIWNYRTGDIQIVSLEQGTGQTYNDQWHVCFRCAQFIEADDSDALTAHCAAYMRWHPDSTEYAILQTLHRGIILSREGRTLLTSTQWRPARIVAEMLPKIRDRFTNLLRSTVDLPVPIGSRGQRRGVAEQLDLAPMYWVNDDFTEMIQVVSGEQPTARITDDVVPSPAGLLAWSQPVGGIRQLAAVSWTPHTDGWQLTGYRSIGTAVDQDLMPTLRHEIGWLIPAHVEHISRRAALNGSHTFGPLITTWLLIGQQVAEFAPAKLPRKIVAASQRNQRRKPDVRIVVIKSRPAAIPELRSETATRRGQARPEFRFWVSGHERQQAYGPGRSLRKTIDIAPFLKGDKSLPIKLSTTVRILRSAEANEDSTD